MGMERVEGVVTVVTVMLIFDADNGLDVGRLCPAKRWGLTSNDETIGCDYGFVDGTASEMRSK